MVLLRLILIVSFGLLGCRTPDTLPRDGTLLQNQIFVHDGKQRRYHLYIPPNVDTPRPLVLTLHGHGGEIDNHIGINRVKWPSQVWLDVAAEEDFYVVVPAGIDERWNDCRRECDRCGEEDDIGFVLALMDHLQATQNIDKERVFSSGESNGGFLTQSLAEVAPERFAGIGVVIALMHANSECIGQEMPMSVMYQVGTEDWILPYDGVSRDEQIQILSARETIDHWRAINQCELEPNVREYPDIDLDDDSTVTREDHSCPKTGTDIAFLTMNGAGHVAPSIAVRVTAIWEGLAGNQNHDIEGVREMWEFFEDRRRTP